MSMWYASILGGLIDVAGTLVGKVLLSLGLSFVTFTAVDAGLDAAKGAIVSEIAGLPGDVVQLLGAFKIGTALGIVFGALAARMALDGLTNGSLKRLVQR